MVAAGAFICLVGHRLTATLANTKARARDFFAGADESV